MKRYYYTHHGLSCPFFTRPHRPIQLKLWSCPAFPVSVSPWTRCVVLCFELRLRNKISVSQERERETCWVGCQGPQRSKGFFYAHIREIPARCMKFILHPSIQERVPSKCIFAAFLRRHHMLFKRILPYAYLYMCLRSNWPGSNEVRGGARCYAQCTWWNPHTLATVCEYVCTSRCQSVNMGLRGVIRRNRESFFFCKRLVVVSFVPSNGHLSCTAVREAEVKKQSF